MRIHYPTFNSVEEVPSQISVNPLHVRYLVEMGEHTRIVFAHDDAVVVATPLKDVRNELAIDDR